MISAAAVRQQLTVGDLVEVVFAAACECEDFHTAAEVIDHLESDVFETRLHGTFCGIANDALGVATRLEAPAGAEPQFGGLMRIPFQTITAIRSLIVGWEIAGSAQQEEAGR